MKRNRIPLLLTFLVASSLLVAQAPAERKANASASESYYQYTLAHLYGQMAADSDDPAEYIDKAIKAYQEAIKANPRSAMLAEELSDFYVQANRAREAQDDAEKAIAKNPDDLAAHRILGRLYVRQLTDRNNNRPQANLLGRAIEEYTAVTRLDPQDVDSLVLLGRLYRINEQNDAARDAFDKALGIDPNNEDALTDLAALFMQMEDVEAATELYERVARNNPTSASLQRLASAYEQMGEPALAAETIRQALALEPPNADQLREAMAQDLRLAGQPEQAAEVFAEIADSAPDNVLARLTAIEIFAEAGWMDRAREELDKALQKDPENTDIRYAEVAVLQAEGRLRDAVDKMQKLVDDTERNVYTTTEKQSRANLLQRLAELRLYVDQTDDAVAAYREIIDLMPEMASQMEAKIIDAYRAGKRYEAAEEEADKAVEQWPDDRPLIMTRALLLADLGRVDEAADSLMPLLDGTSDREIYLQLAAVYDKGKRWEQAESALDEAESLSLLDNEKIGVWFMRGALFERKKDLPAAEAEFRRVLEQRPNHAPTLNYLGYMLADRDVRLDESLKLIEAALKTEPNNGAYLDSLGWVYYRMGRYAEAEEEIRKAVDVTPADPTMFDHYADVLIERGKVDEAVAAYEEALRQWQASSPADQDPALIKQVQQKLDEARQRQKHP